MQAVSILVRDRIVPHYRTLDPAVRLAVLATQRWSDRARRDQIIEGPAFQAWLDAYQPLLAAWNRLVEFEAEWESIQLI